MLEPGAAAQRVRRAVRDARIRDEKSMPAVVGDAADDLAERFAGDAAALPLRVDAPPGLPGGFALMLDLPVADAADGHAVQLDAEHACIVGLPQPEVPGLAVDDLLGGLGASEVAGSSPAC